VVVVPAEEIEKMLVRGRHVWCTEGASVGGDRFDDQEAEEEEGRAATADGKERKMDARVEGIGERRARVADRIKDKATSRDNVDRVIFVLSFFLFDAFKTPTDLLGGLNLLF